MVNAWFSHSVMVSLTPYRFYVDGYTLFWLFWMIMFSGNVIHSCSYLGFFVSSLISFSLEAFIIWCVLNVEMSTLFDECQNPWTLFIEYLLAFGSDSHSVLKNASVFTFSRHFMSYDYSRNCWHIVWWNPPLLFMSENRYFDYWKWINDYWSLIRIDRCWNWSIHSETFQMNETLRWLCHSLSHSSVRRRVIHLNVNTLFWYSYSSFSKG